MVQFKLCMGCCAFASEGGTHLKTEYVSEHVQMNVACKLHSNSIQMC